MSGRRDHLQRAGRRDAIAEVRWLADLADPDAMGNGGVIGADDAYWSAVRANAGLARRAAHAYVAGHLAGRESVRCITVKVTARRWVGESAGHDRWGSVESAYAEELSSVSGDWDEATGGFLYDPPEEIT